MKTSGMGPSTNSFWLKLTMTFSILKWNGLDFTLFIFNPTSCLSESDRCPICHKIKLSMLSLFKNWPAEPVIGKSEVIILKKQSLFKNTASHLVKNIMRNIHTHQEDKSYIFQLFSMDTFFWRSQNPKTDYHLSHIWHLVCQRVLPQIR